MKEIKLSNEELIKIIGGCPPAPRKANESAEDYEERLEQFRTMLRRNRENGYNIMY